MSRPFIIYGLPRSRSFWLSMFLTYGDYCCAHEQMRHVRGTEDARAWLAQDFTGTSETMAAPWWRLVQRYRPDVRTLVVRRPVEDVAASLMALDMRGICAFDIGPLTADLERLDRRLEQIGRQPGVLSVRFSDLADEATCAAVFEHCLPYRHNHEWWAKMSALNLQANMRMLMRHLLAHRGRAHMAIREGKRDLRMILASEQDAVALDGMTIQEESFETFWRDGQALFREHAAEVGAAPAINVDLIRDLERAGASQIITARSNGRMFGYIATVIGPCLEDKALIAGEQLPFYVSPDARGIGRQLQQASVAALRHRGVSRLTLRAGVRGSGPRLGALYRSIGAAPHGELYCLDLRKAA